MSQTTLHIAEQDNVMVALRTIAGGTTVDGVTVASEVPAGHKIATRPIPAGQTVLKYGYPIGVATRDIAPGEHVHSHNLTSTLRDDFDHDQARDPERVPTPRRESASKARWPPRNQHSGPSWRRSMASGAPMAGSACATSSGSSTP